MHLPVRTTQLQINNSRLHAKLCLGVFAMLLCEVSQYFFVLFLWRRRLTGGNLLGTRHRFPSLQQGTLGTENPRVRAETDITGSQRRGSVSLVFMASRFLSCDVVLRTGWAG